MESDLNTLNTFQLLTSKNEIDTSPASVVRGGRRILRSGHYEHSCSPSGTRSGFEQQGLHPDFKTRTSEGLETVGDFPPITTTTTSNPFLQAVYEDTQDAGERCVSESNIHLDLLDAAGTGENQRPGTDEDEIMADAIRNQQSEIIYEHLLRREREILRGCDALSRRFRLMAQDTAIFADDREDVTVRTDKVTVFIRVLFLKIGEINTLKETFTAEIFVQAKWREPLLDGTETTTQSPDSFFDLSSVWNPNLFISNSLGDLDELIWGEAAFDGQGRALVYERRMIKGCFLENLELHEFPFDTQDLTVTLSSERTELEVVLEKETDEASGVNVQTFCNEQEWHLHGNVDTKEDVVSRIYQTNETRHSILSAACRASRRSGFFLWNVFLVMSCNCSLAFSTFTVDLTLSEYRLILSFFLLLTTVTFKFVASQQLPRISYLTYLDKYVLISMTILCCVCAWHAIVPMLRHDPALAKKVDLCVLAAFGCVYLVYHLCFFVCIYYGASTL